MILNTECLGNVGILVEDWDISKSFRPRTITTDYTSWITYISRKNVPAGIELTDNEYWKPIFRIDKEIVIDYNSFKNSILRELNSLKSIVNTFLQSQGGIPLDNKLGDSELVGVTQKVLTEILQGIVSKLGNISGEPTNIINMIVTPEYFTGSAGCDLQINATIEGTLGNFEVIEFYIDDELIGHFEDVSSVTPEDFDEPIHINTNCVVKCVAQIMGITYRKEQAINRVTSFYIGGGNNAADIINSEHRKDIQGGMTGYYDVNLADNDHLLIVMDATYENEFERADLNGFEIPFIKTYTTISDISYVVYKTNSSYIEGIYRIFINR